MTVTYKAQGALTEPVNNLNAAREYLREHQRELPMHTVIYPAEAKDSVHTITWDLLDDSRWEVTLVADCPLHAEQLKLLSEWINGQNSDGLGEGFEQQSFAEHEDDEDEVIYHMSSFDWETNPCTLFREGQ